MSLYLLSKSFHLESEGKPPTFVLGHCCLCGTFELFFMIRLNYRLNNVAREELKSFCIYNVGLPPLACGCRRYENTINSSGGCGSDIKASLQKLLFTQTR